MAGFPSAVSKIPPAQEFTEFFISFFIESITDEHKSL